MTLTACETTDFAGSDVWDPVPGAVLYDDFRNLALGTLLNGRVTPSGHTWEVYRASNWQIIDSIYLGRPYRCAASSSGSWNVMVADLGSNDADIEACFVRGADLTTAGGICLRMTGSGSNLSYYYASNAGNFRRVTGTGPTVTQLGTFPSIGDGDLLRVTAIGSTFTIYRNGVQVAQFVDAVFSGNRHGLFQGFSGADYNIAAVNYRPNLPETPSGLVLARNGPGYPCLGVLDGSGHVMLLPGENNYDALVVDPGIADVDVEVSAALNGTGSGATVCGGGIVVRKAAGDHRGYYVGRSDFAASSGRTYVMKMDAAGAVTRVGNLTHPLAWADYDLMRVVVDGDTMTVYQNGTLIGTLALDASYSSFTQHGIHIGTENHVPGSSHMNDPQLFDYLTMCPAAPGGWLLGLFLGGA